MKWNIEILCLHWSFSQSIETCTLLSVNWQRLLWRYFYILYDLCKNRTKKGKLLQKKNEEVWKAQTKRHKETSLLHFDPHRVFGNQKRINICEHTVKMIYVLFSVTVFSQFFIVERILSSVFSIFIICL